MALDPNIILQAKGVQLDSPLDTYAKVAQVQTARNQNRIADLTFADKARASAADSSLAGLLAGGSSGADVVKGLASQGYGSQALAYQKTNQEALKSAADIKKTEADTIAKQQEQAQHQFEIAGQLAGSWATNPGISKPLIQAGINAAANSGVLTPQVAQAQLADLEKVGDDPRSLNGWAANKQKQVISAKDQMTNALAQQRDAEARRSNMAREANSAGQLAVSRGNLGLAQQRLSFDRQAPRGQVVQTDTGPILVDPRTGQSQPVMRDGKPVTSAKAPTEFQGKSAAFGARAEEADKVLTSLTGKYSPSAINSKLSAENTPLIGGILGAAANKFALSDEDQRAEQAQRDFINAVLRQESGAAIGESEFENARKQYFPQPGNGPGVIAQKARNRKLSIQGLKKNAGRAAFDAEPSGDGNIFDQADAILGGN